jgi:hypothetical protein
VGEIIVPFGASEYPDIDEDSRTFYARGLRSGGTLVIATVEDDRAAALADFFARYGGRTSKNE